MGLLYTPYKIFHFPKKLASLPREVADVLPPVHIRIKPTNTCNHNCRYCAYKAKNLQLGQDMAVRDKIPLEKMMEIIEDLEEMRVCAVTFSGGGEPFCYPYLSETLNRLTETNIRFAALTNGALLEGRAADIFAHHGTWIRVSMDGWDDDSYVRYRRADHGEYTRILNNMEAFQKRGGSCYLGVSYIVDRENASRISGALRHVKDAGAQSVKIAPCIVSNKGAENNDYHLPIFEQVKEQIVRAKEELVSERFEIYDSYHELDEKFAKGYHWCPYQQILPVIGADQNIYPCQDKAYNLNEGLLGTIRHKRFKDFWFADKKAFFRIDPFIHCNHHCVANEKNRTIHQYLDADPYHLGFV